MKLSTWMLVVACFLLTACNSYFNDQDTDQNMGNFQANSTLNGKPRMKITRGSGYGLEVPYDSKYSHS